MAPLLRSTGSPIVIAAGATIVALATATPAAAQVIAHPNQIKGEIAFTNTNPALLAILDDPLDTPPGLGYGMRSYQNVSGKSLPPQSPTLASSRGVSPQSRRRTPYELTVEAGPPGAGIRYDVQNFAAMMASPQGEYRFAPIASDPVEQEPAADVDLDLEECAGAVKLVFRDRHGNPVVASGGWAAAFLEDPPGSGKYSLSSQATAPFRNGQSEQYLVTRGDGSRRRIDVRIQTGSDPYLDLLIQGFSLELAVDCDQIEEVVLTCLAAGDLSGAGLGRIVGEIDVLGEDEHEHDAYTWVHAIGGPWGNLRYGHPVGTPSSGAFELPRMMPSSVVSPGDPYTVQGEAIFRSGRRFQQLVTPSLEVEVAPDAVVDLGDTFVIDPGTLRGDILLQGPPVLDPAIGSTLEDLARASDQDSDGDGIPDDVRSKTLFASAVFSIGSVLRAPGATHSATNAWASGEIDGAYATARESFVGDYELVLGGLKKEPSFWQDTALYLRLADDRTPDVVESYQRCGNTVRHDGIRHLVEAGANLEEPFHLCMSQLNLRYRSMGGNFIRPEFNADGRFDGIDFEARKAAYRDTAWAYGTPLAAPGSDRGLVVATLPQGSFHFAPIIHALNPSGGTSRVELNPLDIDIGCRQVIDVWTDFWVDLEQLPTCTSQATVDVSGIVRGNVEVQRIDVHVNGAGPTVVCGPCGVAPSFSFPVPIGPGRSDIQITAVDIDGRASQVRSFIDRRDQPGDLGNVLRAVRRGIDVEMSWSAWPSALSSELTRDLEKSFSAPASVAVVPLPAEQQVLPGAVRELPQLHFYRVRALNCAGDPGP